MAIGSVQGRRGVAVPFLAAVGCIVISGATAAATPRDDRAPTVVALLVDGLSGEMIDRFATPNLDRLRAEGSWTHQLQPTFPTISGPTWVSLSTGCWPEHHGIVTDKFLDPRLGLMDHSTEVRWLEDCELLQTVAERQGIRTAALGWWGQLSTEGKPTASFVSASVAAEVRVPRDSLVYLGDAERAREVESYLRMPAERRPRLILAYFRGPDHDAHFHGVLSPESGAAVAAFDAALGTILRAVDSLREHERVALLLASDHGSVPVHSIINVNRILRRHDIDARAVTTGTTGFVYFQTGQVHERPAEVDARVDAAFRALATYDAFEVWRKGEFPEYLHVGTAPRVPELIIAAKPGHYTADPDLWPWYLKPLTVFGNDLLDSPLLGAGLRAAHGYAPGTQGNDGVFYAWGDGFQRLGEMQSVRMIDIHPTIADLLAIEPGAPQDGQVLEMLLRPTSETHQEQALRSRE